MRRRLTLCKLFKCKFVSRDVSLKLGLFCELACDSIECIKKPRLQCDECPARTKVPINCPFITEFTVNKDTHIKDLQIP